MHQTVSRKDATSYLEGRHDGSLGSHDLKVVTHGPEAEDLVDVVGDVLEDVLQRWRETDLDAVSSDQQRDQLEGDLSAELHSGLRQLPASVLTDRGFWRFCATYLYDFVVWRHQSTETLPALYPYFGVASESVGFECVPLRMFDRAMIASLGGVDAGSDDVYSLARFGARDVWASHILRVRTSYAPFVAHELLLDVHAGLLPTEKVRLVAKNLKRVRSNVLFEVLDPLQARDMLDRETARAAAALDSGGGPS